jgi:hypothetical protein
MMHRSLSRISHTRLTTTAFAVLLAAVCSMMTVTTQAQEFECSVPGDKRYIRFELPGQVHLCEVTVTKSADGSRRVTWYANHETMFCSAKIYELRAKYENQWGFSCTEWLDTGGIDKLSERHRAILDADLKARIQAGKQATPPYRISGVKAVASNPLNLAEGTLALQYFLVEEGDSVAKDTTHVIFDDGSEWTSIAELDALSEYIDPAVEQDATITSALVYDITGAGVLSVNTILEATTNPDSICQGNQSLLISETDVSPHSPHLVLCKN